MRRLRNIAIVFLLFAAVSVAFWNAGHFLSDPGQPPATADVIAALGGDGGNRVREAGKLYKDHYAPRILLTGIDYGDPAVRPVYLSWRAAYLVNHGVPADALLYDERSGNSWEEAINTRALMEKMGWSSVLVVSDPPHMRRLSWVWGKVFNGSNLKYTLIAAPMPGWDAGHWWRNEKSGQFVLMELIKLAYYSVRH